MSDELSRSQALYLLGFVRAVDAERLAVSHEGPGAVRFVAGEGGLAAVVQRVPLEDLETGATRSRGEDAAWIGQRARRHHEILATIARVAPVAPVKLGAVFEGERRVAQLAGEHAARIARFLDDTEGKEEWGIRVYADEAALERRTAKESPAQGELAARIARAAPGEAYLLERRRVALAEEEVEVAAGRFRANVREAIAAAVEAEVEVPPGDAPRHPEAGDGDEAGEPRTEQLHLAVLVSRAGRERFLDEIGAIGDAHEEAGVLIELSGPWPPYSFCPALTGDALDGRDDGASPR